MLLTVNKYFLSRLLSNRALIQNLDQSNASVCGEAAGECKSSFSSSLVLITYFRAAQLQIIII